MIDDDRDSPSDDESAERAPAEQPTVSATNNETQRQRNERIEREKLEGDVFWKQVFASPVGRREMWRMLAQLHPFEERFGVTPAGFPCPEKSWFHAGEQSFGLRLYHSWCALDRPAVFLMHDEHDQRFAKPKPKRRKAP